MQSRQKTGITAFLYLKDEKTKATPENKIPNKYIFGKESMELIKIPTTKLIQKQKNALE